MRVLRLLLVLGGLAAPLPALSAEAPALDRLIGLTTLDRAVEIFADGIATQAMRGELSPNRLFLAHWQSTATEWLGAGRLEARLAAALDASVSPADRDAMLQFYATPLGLKVAAAERAGSRASPDSAACAKLLAAATPERRDAAANAYRLTNTGITRTMLSEVLRAMLIGLAMAGQHGEIDLPWGDVDAQVSATTPPLLAKTESEAARIVVYVYRDLSDDELRRYLAFLEDGPARRYYAAAAAAFDAMAHDGVEQFGRALALRLRSVGV